MIQHIYVVQYVNPRNNEEYYIGAYNTYEEAEAIVEKYKTYKGFKDAPEHFYIDAYELNKLYWTEGFHTVRLKVKKKAY